jgi:hypothetical protein
MKSPVSTQRHNLRSAVTIRDAGKAGRHWRLSRPTCRPR